MDFLQQKGYSVISQVYQVQYCQVYKASHPGCTVCAPQVAIKVQTYTTQEQLNLSWREVQNMSSLQDLPNVVRLHEHFYEQLLDGNYVLVMVMEWVEKDLMKDMTQRKAHNFPWPEEELIAVAAALIATLAEADRRGIVHRDIKPQNIFLDPITKTVKIGDFGSSKLTSREYQAIFGDNTADTLVGTPAFMSEELKEGLMKRQPRLVYNVVKSDVYSLGATLFSIAKLEVPSVLLKRAVNPDELRQEMDCLSYGNAVKEMLWAMLNPDLSQRPTFQQLEAMYCPRGIVQNPAQMQPEAEVYSQGTELQGGVMSAQSPILSQTDHPIAEHQEKDFLSQQSYPQEEMKAAIREHRDARSCDNCGKIKNELRLPPVFLRCSKCGRVTFCDRNCVIDYVEKCTNGYIKKEVPCLRCSSALDSQEIVQAYGGSDKLERRMAEYNERELFCVCCKERRATHFIECGHIYCKSCLDAYKTPILVKRTVMCAVCGEVTTKKAKKITTTPSKWLEKFMFCG